MENVTEEAKAMELKVIDQVQRFTWNFEEVKAALSERIEKYTGLVVTDENLKDMEKTKKEIASLRVKVDAFRRQVKKDLDAPYKAFDLQVTELNRIISAAEEPIKDQLDKYEQQRIAAVRQELLKYAAQTALGMGLREENAHITIPAKWTQRTAKKTEVRQAICAELDRLLMEQNNRDAAEALAKQKAELVEQLCVSTSELYSLSTPVTPGEIAYLVEDAGIAEIPDIIKARCKERAEVELKAADQARQIAEAQAAAEAAAKEAARQKVEQKAQETAKTQPSTTIPRVTDRPAQYDLTLKFSGITVEQAVALCSYIKAQQLVVVTVEKRRLP